VRRANRRLRLLLVLVVLAFSATLARAVWLQAVRGESLGRLAARQHHQIVEIAAAGRSSTGSASSSRSARRRRRSPRIRGRCATRAPSRSRRRGSSA
jgi:hypothetical protein